MSFPIDLGRSHKTSESGAGKEVVKGLTEEGVRAATSYLPAGGLFGAVLMPVVNTVWRRGERQAQERFDESCDAFEDAAAKTSARSEMFYDETRKMPASDRVAVERIVRRPMLAELLEQRNYYAKKVEEGLVDPSVLAEMDHLTDNFARESYSVSTRDIPIPPTNISSCIDALCEEREKLEALEQAAKKAEEKRGSWWPY